MTTITNSMKIIADLQALIADVMDLLKAGVSFSSIPKLLSMLALVKDMISAASNALPELSDLDAAEAGQLSQAAYALVLSIIAKAK